MPTSLTVYGIPSFSTTLTSATNLLANTSGATSAGHDTRCGTSTGYSEIYPQGTTNAWQSLGSLPAPTGNGLLLDATTLEAQTIQSGNWSAAIRLRINGGTGGATADLYCRIYKRSSGGTYTALGTLSLSGQSIANGSSANYTFPNTNLASLGFITGDKLYIDFWANITANSSGSTTAGLRSDISTSTTAGSTNYQIVTPGYVAATTRTLDLAQRVRLLDTNIQDIALRLIVLPNGIRNLATRLRLFATPLLDLTTRLSVKPQVVSTADATIYKTQIVKAYSPSGTFIDVIRDAPLLSGFKEAVNTAISPLQVVLPRAFDNFDMGGAGGPGTIAQGNLWVYTIFGPGLPVTGKVRYQGIVDAFQPSIDDNGAETVTVTLTPRSSAIADHGIGSTQAFTSSDPVTIFNWWFNNNDPITGHPYAYPLTLDGTNPASSGVSVSYPFVNENLASVFQTVIQMLPANWFFRCNVNQSTTLNTTPLTAQHTFHLGQDCALLQYKQDWTGLRNVIYALGGAPAGYGPETITPVSSPGTGNGLYNAVFSKNHTGTWNITVDPSFTISATGPAISSGTQTVTPSSMTNIVAGVILRIEMGTGTAETVTVSSTTSSTFTATFANAHSGSYIIHLDSSFTVNTTCSTQIGAAPTLSAFTPASGTNIIAGAKYLVGGGTNLQAVVGIATGSDLATFGERLLLVTDTRISDQGSINTLAQGLLALLDQVVIRTKVRIVDYRGDTQLGLGADIETIQVGDSCNIIAPNVPAQRPASLWDTAVWDSSSWDFTPGTAFGQTAQINALTYNFDSVDLEISTLQPNQDAALMRLRNTLQDFTVGTQSR